MTKVIIPYPPFDYYTNTIGDSHIEKDYLCWYKSFVCIIYSVIFF